jgi:hypothetical protein
MSEQYYLVEDDLSVYPIQGHLSDRYVQYSPLFDQLMPADKVHGHAEPGIPVSPDGTLKANTLYPSSSESESSVRFYLPTYQLNTVDGLYTTRLKWSSPRDPITGAIAFLTVDLAGQVPNGQGWTLREIPHVMIGRIVYKLPVHNLDGTVTIGPELAIELGPFESAGGNVRHCRYPVLNKPDFDRLYEIMTKQEFKGRLEVRCFATIGYQTWRQIVTGLIDDKLQVSVLAKEKLLFTNVLDDQTLANVPIEATHIASHKIDLHEVSVKPMTSVEISNLILDKPLLNLPAALYTGLHTAMLGHEISAHELSTSIREARIANPDIRHQMRGGFSAPDNPSLMMTNPILLQPNLTPVHLGIDIDHTDLVTGDLNPALSIDHIDLQLPNLEVIHPTHPIIEAGVVQPAQPISDISPLLNRAYAKNLSEMLVTSDLVVEESLNHAVFKALPLRLLLDDKQQPALLRTEAEVVQAVDPFWFLVDTNAYIFDMPGDLRPTKTHTLLPYQIVGQVGEVISTFYQDSALPDQFYYEPQAFRLKRLDIPPYIPDLNFIFLNVVSQDAQETTLHYQVKMRYRALPYIDPDVLERARIQTGVPGARFIALSPSKTRVVLQVPLDDGALRLLERDQVTVDFGEGGMSDTLDLSQTEFERVIAAFQLPDGVGLHGNVEATLLGENKAQVPIELSFKCNTGSVFGYSQPTALGGGMYRVTLTNRIESPVYIHRIYDVSLPLNGVVTSMTVEPIAPVQPGGTFDITYSVNPPETVLTQIMPLLSTSIQPNLAQLIVRLLINQRYKDDTFSINVSLEDGYLGGAPSGGEPLTGVLVEFESGVSVTLNSIEPQSVTLKMPLLPFLLQDPGGQFYRYRTTNLHGSGETLRLGMRSAWQTGFGDMRVLPTGA